MSVLNRGLKLSSKMARIVPVYKKTELTNGQKCDEDANANLIQPTLDRQLNPDAIKEANDLLVQGKLIALPTDTIYGIACLAENNAALNRLAEIKNRDLAAKFFAICVNNLNDIYKWSKVTVDRQVLADLLPGAVTVIFERSKLLNKNLNPSNNLIGIRIPSDGFVHSLTYLNSPLALTSANLSGEPSAGSVNEFGKLWPKLDAVFDGGQLNNGSDPFRLGSTVVDLSVPTKFRIIRKGCAIQKVLDILQDKYSFEEIV